jgi:hypothetical protein
MAEHAVGRPADCGDGWDAQPFVDLGSFLVIDSGCHAIDAERLAGQPRRDDVRVVATGHGCEGVGPFDARFDQHLAVKADAGHGKPGEVRSQPAKGIRVLVDDRDRMASTLEVLGQSRTDAPAPHDHDVHAGPP